MVWSGGMEFSQVLSVYSIATVGDGLVSQIPALMISTSAGMIVTRAASEGNLNQDVAQFAAQPKALIITEAVMAMSIIPGAPVLQIIVLGSLLIAMGIILMRAASTKQRLAEEEEMQRLITDEKSEADYYRNIDNVYNLLGVEPIEMEFGYSLLPLVDEASGGSFIDRIVIFRKQFAMDMGVVVPR